MRIFLFFVLCLSLVSGLRTQSRLQLLVHSLSQSESELTHKCQDAIIRWKNNPTINIDSMIKAGTIFTDSNF